MSITLAELREQSRQRADMGESQFVEDPELNEYINKSIAELHDILIQSYGSDYFLEEYSFSIVNGTAAYALPSDFYKLYGVDLSINSNEFQTIKKFNFNERNRFTIATAWNWVGFPNIRYRLMGANIRFSPVPNISATGKIWYTPLATKLVSDSDTLNDFNQYSEYVIIDAAIKMRIKEESDVADLNLQKAAIIKRITEASQNRDISEPESVSDAHNENDDLS